MSCSLLGSGFWVRVLGSGSGFGVRSSEFVAITHSERCTEPRTRTEDREPRSENDDGTYNVVVPSSIRRDIGQLLIGSLPGTTIPTELRSLAREFQLGGVILFSRNIEGKGNGHLRLVEVGDVEHERSDVSGVDEAQAG